MQDAVVPIYRFSKDPRSKLSNISNALPTLLKLPKIAKSPQCQDPPSNRKPILGRSLPSALRRLPDSTQLLGWLPSVFLPEAPADDPIAPASPEKRSAMFSFKGCGGPPSLPWTSATPPWPHRAALPWSPQGPAKTTARSHLLETWILRLRLLDVSCCSLEAALT